MHVYPVKRYPDASVGTPSEMKEVAEFTDRSVDIIEDDREAADDVKIWTHGSQHGRDFPGTAQHPVPRSFFQD